MTRATSNHVLHDPDRVSELIGSIYAAAMDAKLWDAFAEKLGHALDVKAVNFLLSSRRADGELGFIPSSWGIDPEVIARFREEYVGEDPHMQPSLELPSGLVFTNNDVFPDDELVHTRYFKEFYSQLGLRYGFGLVIRKDGDSSSLILCHRGADQAPPNKEDLQLLGMLTKHLQRARALAVDLGTLNEQVRVAFDLIDRGRVGVIFLNRDGHVMHMNERAEIICGEDDGLATIDGMLRAPQHADTKALHGIVEVAAATTQGRGFEGASNVRLPRPSGRRPLDVSALPIGSKSHWWSVVRASVCLLINDGEAGLEGTAIRLRELYQLSEVEAELAVAIALGHTVRDWAEHRGVSVETVRWQLKQVFAKTGTSRQPELMRMVLQGPGVVR